MARHLGAQAAVAVEPSLALVEPHIEDWLTEPEIEQAIIEARSVVDAEVLRAHPLFGKTAVEWKARTLCLRSRHEWAKRTEANFAATFGQGHWMPAWRIPYTQRVNAIESLARDRALSLSKEH